MHGQCLVDDFATLTSDPVHRSAWRAAIAMLGAEGMPEYADIAALFNLADLVAAADDEMGEMEPEESSVLPTRNSCRAISTVRWPC